MNLFGLTDTGKVRADNQDSYAIRVLDDDLAVAVVCDGMGGAQAGNVASAVAVETFAAAVEEACRQQLPETEREREHLMREACYKANQVVHDLSLSTPGYHGMGTTLVLAVVVGEQMHIVNIGDSRIYMVEKRAVKQLTRDHTLVQNMIDRGELSVEEAEHHPKKHYITRAIGVGDTLDIDYQMYELKKESVVLLCTDGLSNYLKLEKLPELLKSCIRKGSLQELIDYANNRGGSDNITAVVLYRQ